MHESDSAARRIAERKAALQEAIDLKQIARQQDEVKKRQTQEERRAKALAGLEIASQKFNELINNAEFRYLIEELWKRVGQKEIKTEKKKKGLFGPTEIITSTTLKPLMLSARAPEIHEGLYNEGSLSYYVSPGNLDISTYWGILSISTWDSNSIQIKFNDAEGGCTFEQLLENLVEAIATMDVDTSPDKHPSEIVRIALNLSYPQSYG